MSEQLKPCPFCGNTEISEDDGYIMCQCCGVMIDQSDAGNSDYVAAWNLRPEGTTSDKYRAELYDEVWQLARDMGHSNVTEAFAAKDARIAELESENSHLRHGMTGDYDLDAWLEWCAKKDAIPSEDGVEVPATEDELTALGLGYPLSKEEAVNLYYMGFRSPVITVLEAWEAIGHDIGCNPTKEELLASLQHMAEKCAAQPARQVGGDVRESCAICDGTGKDGSYDCGTCEGKGYIEFPLIAVALAPAAVVMPVFATKIIKSLKRFDECVSDGEGVDIGRHMLDVLTKLGLLDRVQRSPALWQLSDTGEEALKVDRLNRRAIPVGLLERCLEQMESDWLQIDGEWGPTKGGLEGAVANGDAEEIRELRALLGKEGE